MTIKHLRLRLAADLHALLKKAAAKDKRSINAYVEILLEKALKK